MTVRVRFAPSPTGYLHIGGARTALYNYLYARHLKGSLILRIEDTDLKRNTEQSYRSITEGLSWLGIRWDEGPFYQSQRLEVYKRYAAELEQKGRAYWREDPGKGRALYFKIDRRKIDWTDLVHGPSCRDISVDPDLVLVKSDGFPTYNFACVIDDHEMGITDVFRADEHFPNTPKQISLYGALGWPPPRFGHMPLIFDPKGEKISKRKSYDFPVTLEEARVMGYLPEAVSNFVALLGWSPGNNVELMTMEEMIGLFTADRIGSTPAKFLVDKLNWMNKQYMKRLRPEDLIERIRRWRELMAFLIDRPPADNEGLLRRVESLRPSYDESEGLLGLPADKLNRLISLHLERMDRLPDLVPLTRFCTRSEVEFEAGPVDKVLKKEGVAGVLKEVKSSLSALEDFSPAPLEESLKQVAAKLNVKFGQVAQPVRVAATGSDRSPPIHDTLALLGREAVLARLDRALELIRNG
jgi:glutamyl/glutaminyl-tRNA synthetase